MLLEPGREHPYAVVSVVPKGLSADLKLAAVDMLDVGDPEIVTTVDVGGEPTALAADGQNRFYVSTAGGEVVVFDRAGDQQARFAVGGNLSGLAYDGSTFWAAAADGDVLKPFDKTGALGTPRPTGGSDPVAVVATGTSIWVANEGSQTVTQTTASGVASTTPVPGKPIALAVSPSPSGVVFVAVVNPAGTSVIQGIDATGTITRTEPCSAIPRALALYDVLAVGITPVYTSADGVHATVGGVLSVVAGGPSRGMAVGTGAIWVALESNELGRYFLPLSGSGGTEGVYPVGSGPDAVLFDTDRVYVANRAGHSVSIVHI